MIKKALLAVTAAGAVSVALAGTARADPDILNNPGVNADNPGLVGNIAAAPGMFIKQIGQLGVSPAKAIKGGDWGSPGDALNDYAPPKLNPEMNTATQNTTPEPSVAPDENN